MPQRYDAEPKVADICPPPRRHAVGKANMGSWKPNGPRPCTPARGLTTAFQRTLSKKSPEAPWVSGLGRGHKAGSGHRLPGPIPCMPVPPKVIFALGAKAFPSNAHVIIPSSPKVLLPGTSPFWSYFHSCGDQSKCPCTKNLDFTLKLKGIF